MLTADTEEKRKKIKEILGQEVYTSQPCDFDDDCNDITKYERIYIDGDVTYDQMAAIVDYLRNN